MNIAQQRSELFFQWERTLRGWDVYAYPIEIEPQFVPCPKDAAYAWQEDAIDDARHPTVLSRFADRISTKTDAGDPETEDDIIFPSCRPRERIEAITEFHLVLPQDLKTQKSLMGHIFTALTFVREPLSFEVIGSEQEIAVVLTCATSDADTVYQQLIAHEPDCVIDQTHDYLKSCWEGELESQRVVDFGLEHEVMRPLVASAPSYDALIGVMGALSGLHEDECGVLQILFHPASQNWAHAFVDAVTNDDGSGFFSDAPNMVTLAKQKVRSSLTACVIRACARAKTERRQGELLRGIGGSLMSLRDPSSNSLFPLTNDAYPRQLHVSDVMGRTSHRSGMVLNLEELTTIAHLPDASVRIPKLKRVTRRTKAAPALVTGHALTLGVNTHRGVEVPVTLDIPHRMRHMHLVGASGTGKSTMLLNMICQDMEAGNGIAVLDPHGDLIDTVLKRVPENRLDDVIVFDPSDEEHPVGFNILDAHSELENVLLASDLTSVFRRLSSSWGDQMNSVLANGIIAMLESERGGTLPILRRFLVDKEFRKEHLKTVRDPENVFYWEREFPLLSGKPQGPVLTRLDTFLRPKPIRNMVAQKENKIDFADVMQGQKIFLAKLSHGAIGAENSYLMGAFLVTKLNQMAFARQAIPEEQRKPFYLYIDEFHNFITPSMESILSGTRKYNLSFVLAHQQLRQLEGKDTDVAESVLANPFSRVCFRLGDKDAKVLQNGFSYFDANDLQSLGIGQAIMRAEQSAFDFNLQTPMLAKIDDVQATKRAREIINASKQRYGTPKDQVENLIYESLGKSKPVDEKATSKKCNQSLTKSDTSLAGRGGREHKELQNNIKQLGEQAGFRSTIEKPIRDEDKRITGHVDVALERDDLRIACEISVTTNAEQELKNIRKCLSAGFDRVLIIGSDDLFDALNTALSKQEKVQVSLLSQEQLQKYLAELADHELRIHGYVVQTQFEETQTANNTKKRIIELLKNERE